LTYKQAAELGAQVRGRERGTTVVFFKRPSSLPGRRRKPSRGRCRWPASVFNVEQIDRLPDGCSSLRRAERLAAGMRRELLAKWRRVDHGGFAALHGSGGPIQLERELFGRGEYYATAFMN
jgi:hypothetical protein